MPKLKTLHAIHVTDHDNSYIHTQCSEDITVIQGMLTKLGYKRSNSIGPEVYTNTSTGSEAVIRTLVVVD